MTHIASIFPLPTLLARSAQTPLRVSAGRIAGHPLIDSGQPPADGAACAGNSVQRHTRREIDFRADREGVKEMAMYTAHTVRAIERMADLQCLLWEMARSDGYVEPREERLLAVALEVSLTMEEADWSRRAAASMLSIGRLSDYLHKQRRELDGRWREMGHDAPEPLAA